MKVLLDKKMQDTLSEYTLSDDVLLNLADFFSVFADSTRLKLISALSITNMCVSDISNLLCINQTTVSHQLKVLRNCKMVKIKRQGKVIFYSLSNEIVPEMLLKGVEYLGY